jgi:membrane-bound lytic murein transglycosylase D
LSKDYPTYDLKLPKGSAELYQLKVATVADLTPDRRVRYIVKRGDTLGEIAARFRVSWRDIKKWNSIRGSRIYPGQSLYIKPGRGWGKSSSKSVARTSTVETSGDYLLYKIRKGDTLSEIAEHHGVSVRSIKKWNGIKNSKKIRPGQQLKIYAKGES